MTSISYALAEYLVTLATPTISAVIPDLVYVEVAPQGITGDHILITRYSDDPNNDLQGMGDLQTADFDIDCKSSDSEQSAAIGFDIKNELDLLLNTQLNENWLCGAVIINGESDGYDPPPSDGQDVTIFITTVEITLQYKRL